MTVSEALSAGFVRAHGRVGSIFLDALWKGIWLAVTTGFLFFFLVWMYSESQSIEVHVPVNVLRSPIGLLVLGRELWTAYASTLFWSVALLVVLSASAWILLEAYFRAGILAISEGSFVGNAAKHFRIFLASAVVRILVIGAVLAFFGSMVFARYIAAPSAEWRGLWQDTRGPFLVGIVVGATVWFLLMLLETLIRSDALELLGRDLFFVAGLTATLVTFEGMVVVIFAASVLALVMTLSSAAGALTVLAVIVGSLVLLSVVHSYLLIVRFFSISEAMSRNQRPLRRESRIMSHVDDL